MTKSRYLLKRCPSCLIVTISAVEHRFYLLPTPLDAPVLLWLSGTHSLISTRRFINAARQTAASTWICGLPS